jgi:hypothetical protein
MDSLRTIIASLSREEVRHFKMHLKRVQTAEERKDEMLFDYIRTKGDDYNEDKVFRKLYPGIEDKNSFYRLKNRLQDMICENLVMLHDAKDEQSKLLHYHAVYHVFAGKSQFELALHYLKKAEKLAEKAENLEMLDLIFAGFVRISNELPEINPEAYIEKRRQNAERLNKLREMDQILSIVVYRMKMSQAKGREDLNTLAILDDITQKYSDDDALSNSKTFQTRIYRAVSQTLLQRHNYKELQRFMVAIYKRFTSSNWFDKTNHDTKLQMLVYLVNSFSMIKNYKGSLSYADELGKEMERFNKLHYDKYALYYYNAQVINYSETDPAKALQALRELETSMAGKLSTYYEMFIHLNRGILNFKVGKYQDAIRSFVKYYTNDYYKQSDSLFKLRVAIVELMMHVESKDIESTTIRLEQVRRQFKEEWQNEEAYAEKKIYELLKLVAKWDGRWKSESVTNTIKSLLTDKAMRQHEGSQLVNYLQWIKTKEQLK